MMVNIPDSVMHILGYVGIEQLADTLNQIREGELSVEEYEFWDIVEQFENHWGGGFKEAILESLEEDS